MFDNLRRFIITKIENGVPITFPIGIGAASYGVRMLAYLYMDEKEDYAKSEYPKIRLPTDTQSLAALEALKVRFMSRITSYVTITCTLDGILTRSYMHLVKLLREMSYGNSLPTDNGSALLRQRKKEIKDYLFWRNKVFAHTAFESPRKDDNRSLQYSSLFYFSGNLTFLKDHYIALGGGLVIVDRQELPPELSIVKEHANLEAHYSRWEHMFVDILNEIPQEELKSKLQKVELL